VSEKQAGEGGPGWKVDVKDRASGPGWLTMAMTKARLAIPLQSSAIKQNRAGATGRSRRVALYSPDVGLCAAATNSFASVPRTESLPNLSTATDFVHFEFVST